ncbi:MAG: 4'-phosphopantetheinyl transferase superfamily protein, partial [Evtepia sp.]
MCSVFISDTASDDLLLKSAIRYSKLPPEMLKIDRTADGKPYFPLAPQVQFSITHSGRFWCCAFSDTVIGLDLQIHRPCRKESISKRFFCADEDDFLKAHHYDDKYFFDLWAAKESFFKYTGTGLRAGLSSI